MVSEADVRATPPETLAPDRPPLEEPPAGATRAQINTPSPLPLPRPAEQGSPTLALSVTALSPHFQSSFITEGVNSHSQGFRSPDSPRLEDAEIGQGLRWRLHGREGFNCCFC